MSYVLCIAFQIKVFKKLPLVRINIDDHFIDEFNLTYNERNTVSNIPLSESWLSYRKNYDRLTPISANIIRPKKLKYTLDENLNFRFYELDENFLRDKNKNFLYISIFNDDNNYTNGFITKSTLVSLGIVFVVPKYIIKNFTHFQNQWLENSKTFRHQQMKLTDIKKFYKSRTEKFNLLISNSKAVYKDYDGLHWYSNKNKSVTIQNMWEWVGDSGYYKLQFDKNLINFNNNDHGDDSINFHLLDSIATKYTQYENQ